MICILYSCESDLLDRKSSRVLFHAPPQLMGIITLNVNRQSMIDSKKIHFGSKGAVTLSNASCNLSHNVLATQVAWEIA